MWNSLELAKLFVSALTPIVVILVGFFINRKLKQLEAIQWANQKVVEKRLEVFDALAPSLNDLLCYFTYIGNWKELSPSKVVEIKRALDKKAYINAPLFSWQFLDRYAAFIGTCFRTYSGVPRPVSFYSTYNTKGTIVLRQATPRSRTGLWRGLGF
jgi:hypothetical protein